MGGPTEYDKQQNADAAKREADQKARDKAQDKAAADADAADREAQEKRDKAQDDANARQDTRLKELGNIHQDPPAPPETPGAEPASGAQRLRISVPTIRTDVTLGSAGAASAAREGLPNRAGFGVATAGDIFMTADERVAIQATKDVIVQSETADMWVGGSGRAILAGATGPAVVTGGGGVLIAGGSLVSYAPNFGSDDGPLEDAPAWADGWGDVAGQINQASAAVDAAVAVGFTLKAMYDAVFDSPKGWAGWTAMTAGILGGISGAAASIAGSCGKDSFGGTVIFGLSGWVGTTPNTMGLYSGMGTTVASVVGVGVVSPGSVSLIGGLELSGYSKMKINLNSGGVLDLQSTSDAVLASKDGTLSLGGKAVAIGSHGNAETVSVDGGMVAVTGAEGAYLASANSSVSVDPASADVSSDGKVNLKGAGGVSVKSPAGVVVGSDTKAALRSGEFLSYVTPDKAVFGMAPGPLPAVPAPPTLEVPPPQPPVGNRALRRWCDLAGKLDARNRKKLKAHGDDEASWLSKAENLKDAQVGVIVKSSGVEIVCDGYKLTLDSGKIKTANLVIKK